MISLQPAKLSTPHSGQRTLQTNHGLSLVSLKDTFPYVAEPATSNGVVSSLDDGFREVSEHRSGGNWWVGLKVTGYSCESVWVETPTFDSACAGFIC